MRRVTMGFAILTLAAAGAALAAGGHEHGSAGPRQHSPELAALMQQNRAQFTALVEKAYFTGVLRQLKEEDFQAIRESAQGVAGHAARTRSAFSRGKEFDHLAEELAEHAGKAARGAARGDHPEVNKEVGEMAEYCAKCHDAFRW